MPQVLKHVITDHSDAVSCVSFSPHDQFLASGRYAGGRELISFILLIKLSIKHSFVTVLAKAHASFCKLHTEPARCQLVTSSSVCSVDGALLLHDAHNRGSPVCLVASNSVRQNALHSSNTDAAIASANEDGHILVWDAAKHTRVWSRALHRVRASLRPDEQHARTMMLGFDAPAVFAGPTQYTL